MSDFDPTRHASHPGASQRHLPGLDGIRGLAILMVMFTHFIVVGDNLEKGTVASRLLHSGYLGVDLFFVLSGFLITGILLDSRGTPGYFRVFYIRRALRIFPLYYALLAVAWLTVIFITPGDRAELTGEDSMAWFWLYASNIGMAVKGTWLASPTWVGLGHFWSLAVEEQFYLVWPMVVVWLPVRWLKRLCFLMVLASPLVFFLLMQWLGSTPTYVSTLSRLGVLAAGGGLAILWREPGAWPRLRRFLLPVAVASGLLLLAERTWLPLLSFAEPPLVLLCGAACVALAAEGAGPWFYQSAVLRWLGKYSYGLYVYHHALKPVWLHFLWDGWIAKTVGTGWAGTVCYFTAASALSVGLAWLSWKCFEAPILSLKSRFRYRPATVRAGSSAAVSPGNLT